MGVFVSPEGILPVRLVSIMWSVCIAKLGTSLKGTCDIRACLVEVGSSLFSNNFSESLRDFGGGLLGCLLFLFRSVIRPVNAEADKCSAVLERRVNSGVISLIGVDFNNYIDGI